MTFAEAISQVGQIRDAAPAVLSTSIDELGREAADRIAAEWPVATGRSQTAWEWDGRSIENRVEYASEVHDGLAADLIPQVVAELEPKFRERVVRRLDAAGGA